MTSKKSLGSVAMVGSALQVLGRGLRALAGIGTIAILARFLSPSDFGSFALIYSLVMLAQVFADLGLRVALVQKADITDLECYSVFWTSTASGLVLTTLLFLFADEVASLFQTPGLGHYIRIISPIFIIVGMRGVPLALLERRFEFKKIAGTEIFAALTGSLMAIAFALAGAKIGALVAQQLTMVIVLAAMLFYHARWLPRFRFSRAALKPLTSYGGFVTISGILHSTGPMISRPLIGTRLSTADLGFLTMSEQIVMTPVRIIATSVRRVVFPLLSSFQSDNARIINAHQNALHALVFALAPCTLGIAALAEPVSALLLGPAWTSIAVIIAIVAPRALAGGIGELNGAVFASKGQARFQFLWGIFTLGMGVTALLLLIPYGIVAIALGQLTLSALVVTPVYTWFLARLLGTTTLSLLAPMVRPLLAAVTMAGLVHLLDMSLDHAGMPTLVRIAAGVSLGVVLYGGLILLIDRERALELLEKVKAARKKRKA